MSRDPTLSIFEDFHIRRHYDEEKETRYFSVIDIIAALIEQRDYKKAKSYRTTLNNRLKNEGSEVVTKYDQLKMIASDGKMRLTDVTDVETILRLVQSVPSKKAEPIKQRLAKVEHEARRKSKTKKPKKNKSLSFLFPTQNNAICSIVYARKLYHYHGIAIQFFSNIPTIESTRCSTKFPTITAVTVCSSRCKDISSILSKQPSQWSFPHRWSPI